MAKKQFKSESKRLLDLMINSIYTHKEIFLREIISNASDAIDKLCYISLTDDKVGLSREDFKISIRVDRDARTITVSDNGVGMTAQELEQNLGVIAKSGSLQWKREVTDKPEDMDMIGQFGVGFYSAFMVAKKVTVLSRAYGAETASAWVSTGADGYTISEAEKDTVGTDIVMELKDDSEDEHYSEYLEEHTLHNIVRKYSDYIRWPIEMDVTRSRQVETEEIGEDGQNKKTWEDYTETEVINSRIPIWQRPKSEVSDEECMQFYREKFYDFEEPVAVIRIAAEGLTSYKALLFIPAVAPVNYFTKEYEAGLQLYTAGVMIMEHCAELLPEHFRFVRGVVDSQDLSLNISREMLQHDRQLKVIRTNLEKKIKAELKRLLENEREKYDRFYKSFGIQLKYGILNGFGANKEMLQDLLMFYSSRAEGNVTLAEYAQNMPEEQKYIYYACGENIAVLKNLPQAESVRERGYEILYLTDNADEFVVKMLAQYEEKEFRSVTDDDLGLLTDDEKKKTEALETEHRALLDFVKESLGERVAAVKLSEKLKSNPVCLSTQGGVTLEMERYFASLPGQTETVKAERVLELNPEHRAFAALRDALAGDRERAAKYAELLYGQSQLIAGLAPEDPVRFTELVSELMV